MYVLDAMIPAVRAEEAAGTRRALDRPPRRRHPAARHPGQPGRLRHDQLHEPDDPSGAPGDGQHVRHPHRRPGLRDELVGRRRRQQPARRPCPPAAPPPTRTGSPTIPPSRAPTTCIRGPATARRWRTGSSARSSSSRRAPPTATRPPGSPQVSGWEADIIPASGAAFRENVKIFHEIGNESENETWSRSTSTASPLPDHRPAHRRLPPRLAGDQLPLRAVHGPARLRAGPEVDGVRLLHVRATRRTSSRAATSATRRSSASSTPAARSSTSTTCTAAPTAGASTPKADPTFDYGKTGLDKHPVDDPVGVGPDRLAVDGPGRVVRPRDRERRRRRTAGGGRVPVPLPHRPPLLRRHVGLLARLRHAPARPHAAARPTAAAAGGRLVRASIGRERSPARPITAQNLDAWIRPQLPTQGVTRAVNAATGDTADQDASVWDWTVDAADRPLPRRAGPAHHRPSWAARPCPGPTIANVVPGHPAALIVDQVVAEHVPAQRQPGHVRRRRLRRQPAQDPVQPDERPAGLAAAATAHRQATAVLAERPLRRALPRRVRRNGTSPGPAGRHDEHASPSTRGRTATTAICPAGAPLRTFNVVGHPGADPGHEPRQEQPGRPARRARRARRGQGRDLSPARRSTPGCSRASRSPFARNIGDCVALTYTSELTDGGPEVPFSKTNIHIHHVQFDTQASDGVISGFSYEQSIRPYKVVDPQLTVARPAVGATVLNLASVAKFQAGRVDRRRPGHRGHRDPPDHVGRRGVVDQVDAQRGARATPTRPASGPAPSSCSTAGTRTSRSTTSSSTTTSTASTAGATAWSASSSSSPRARPTTTRSPVRRSGPARLADIHTDPNCVPRTDARATAARHLGPVRADPGRHRRGLPRVRALDDQRPHARRGDDQPPGRALDGPRPRSDAALQLPAGRQR